jgi:fucokinase
LNSHSSADSGKSYSGLEGSCDSNLPDGVSAGWDFVVFTASNEDQASGYRKQIEYRFTAGLLPKNIHFVVVPDIEGKRIGSGGATFNVLRYIRENSNEEDCFSKKRILVINSGGDSKRIPQYSACGKLFLPVPRELSEGISATLFDEILKSVDEVSSQMPAGMLTVTGDILIVFDQRQIKLTGCDAAAISVNENVRTGINHGVFIPDKKGNVRKFLHKSSIDELRRAGAKDSSGNVHLDTGVIWFSSDIVKDLFNLISTDRKIDDDKFNEFANEKARLSFYADFVYPMASDSSLNRFYSEKPEGGYTDKLKCCRTALWTILHKYTMKLITLSPSFFIHLGTTAELLKLMTKDIKKYTNLGWSTEVNTNAVTFGRFSANSSFVNENTIIGDGSYIENSCLYNSKVGKGCIISNITLDSFEIPDNTVVHCLKQKDGNFVVRIYGTYDNPKQGLNDGGTFLGMPIREFMQKHKLKEADLWDNKPYSLWNAKLYCESCALRQSLEYALRLCDDFVGICEVDRRVSLEQSYENAEVDYVLTGRIKLEE